MNECPICGRFATDEFFGELYCEECAQELTDSISETWEAISDREGYNTGSALRHNLNCDSQQIEYFGRHPWLIGG